MTLHCLYSSSAMDKEELEIIKDVIGEDRVSDTVLRNVTQSVTLVNVESGLCENPASTLWTLLKERLNQ